MRDAFSGQRNNVRKCSAGSDNLPINNGDLSAAVFLYIYNRRFILFHIMNCSKVSSQIKMQMRVTHRDFNANELVAVFCNAKRSALLLTLARNFSTKPHIVVRVLRIVGVDIHLAVVAVEVYPRHDAVGQAVHSAFFRPKSPESEHSFSCVIHGVGRS